MTEQKRFEGGMLFVAATYKPTAASDRLVLTFSLPDGYAEATLTLDQEERLLRSILDRRARAREREGVSTSADLMRQDEVDAAIMARGTTR